MLPLLAADAGIDLQVQTGIAAHRRRFGAWAGGFWLPECGYAPWLDPRLKACGVRLACVELTGWLGAGHPAHLQPLATDDGPVLWPIDRSTMALVWSDGGYPRAAPTATRTGTRAFATARGATTAAPTTTRRRWPRPSATPRRSSPPRPAACVDGGVCVVALDTELLGHWWHEGVAWLGAVIAAARRRGLPLTTLDDARRERHPARRRRDARGAVELG